MIASYWKNRRYPVKDIITRDKSYSQLEVCMSQVGEIFHHNSSIQVGLG